MERLVDSEWPRPHYQGDLCQCCQMASSVSLSLEVLSGLIHYSCFCPELSGSTNLMSQTQLININMVKENKQRSYRRSAMWMFSFNHDRCFFFIWICFFLLYHLKMTLSCSSFKRKKVETWMKIRMMSTDSKDFTFNSNLYFSRTSLWAERTRQFKIQTRLFFHNRTNSISAKRNREQLKSLPKSAPPCAEWVVCHSRSSLLSFTDLNKG